MKLKDVRCADIDLDFVEAPAQIRDKVSSGPYDIYFVDLVLAREWGDVSLHRVLEDLAGRGPVVLISSVWDKTNFEELRNEWSHANIRLGFQWREIWEERSRPVVVLQLQKALDERRKQENLHLDGDAPVRILHLSDLQFGGFDDSTFRLESQTMGDMVRRVWPGHGPTFIAITGDIAEGGLPEEYRGAETWLKVFVSRFGDWLLPSSRILLVEGNHDVCLPLAASGRIVSGLLTPSSYSG